MLRRLLQRRSARSSSTVNSRSANARLANPELLETRAMLAADPIGELLLVYGPFSTAQRNSIVSVDAVVAGEQQATIVFHGQGISAARLAGTDREIFFQQFSDNTASGALVTANQITRGEQFGPRTDVAEDGSFWVAWSGRGEGDRVGIFARRFDADGTALGDQIRINSTRGGDQVKPDVAVAADGSAVIVWQGVGGGDFDGIFAQRIDADGALIGAETLVNQTTDDLQAYPTVTIDASTESYVVAWSSRHQDGSDWGIFARQFDTTSEPLGDEFQVNETTAGSQHKAAIDANADGGFVITWSSLGQDGDSWGVFGRQFAADGSAAGDEFQISDESAGQQRDASVAAADAGEFLVAWNEGASDGSGWEVMARAFNADGLPDGDEILVHESVSGVDSGHQTAPAVALNAFGNSVIAYEGDGAGNQGGVFAQPYEVDVAPAENLPPEIEQIDDTTATVGELLIFDIQATDPNRNDELTFELDTDVSPPGAELEIIDGSLAVVTWTPGEADRLTTAFFRVIVTDNGDPPLAEAVQFSVTIENAVPVIDLNGLEESGIDLDVELPVGSDSVSIGMPSLTVRDADQTTLDSATLTLRGVSDIGAESIAVDTTGTSIEAVFENNILRLTGGDTVTAYQRVLQTLTYTNDRGTERTPGLRQVDIRVSDGDDESRGAIASIQVRSSTNPPTLAALADQELLAGSPLHIPLNGMDLDGDTLTYTITSSNPSLVSTFVPEGNRSMRVSVSSPGNNISGDMVFELFEGRVPRATDRIITLAESDFYDGLTFHRILDNFVIQGGDPNGDGSGGSDLPTFDDQLRTDLQHNRTGLLSMAKSFDDTNNSQFFVTEGPTRHLDGNHTIFGILVEGEATREAVSNVPAGAGGTPSSPVFMDSVTIFEDNQNAVLMLSAEEGATGSATITVRVSDGTNTATQSFDVTVSPDTGASSNTRPFLGDDWGGEPVLDFGVPMIETAVDTPTTFQLPGIDVEGDPIVFLSPQQSSDLSDGFPAQLPPADLDVTVDSATGLVTITPSNGITGTFEVTFGVSTNNFSVNDFQTIEIRVA